MALGDGIRRNVATISQEERNRLRDAVLLLDTVKPYPDGSSYWDKQDEIHEATHVHGGPQFLPWHRELCNRFETLLREVDPALSLHYWDWTTDPRSSTGGLNLFSSEFMGSSQGQAGPPLQNFAISRNVNGGSPGAPSVSSDKTTVTTGDGQSEAQQFLAMRGALEGDHGSVHGYIGGTIGNGHTAFEDPFVFLLHSNVDRLFAKWQLAPTKNWRLDPERIYGAEENTSGVAGIITPMEPWAGGSGLRPWAPPENQQQSKNSRDPSVVWPPLYDVGTQPNWRWCKKCECLAFAGHATPGTCPAGGKHDHSGSGNYTLIHDAPAASGQADWRWCKKCECLAFAGHATPGTCPAGGKHDHSGSGNYKLQQLASNTRQADWRWCQKCQGLAFGRNGAPGPCPAGGKHDHAGSGNYSLFHNFSSAPGQTDWRWCKKCEGLAFAAHATPGTCPAGGKHDHAGSGRYTLLHNFPLAPGQHNWRWCKKCEGLAFGKNVATSVCPAGGKHDHAGSGDYSLLGK